MNKVVIMGNLTKDIEMRYADSGTAFGSTSIALNRKYKDGKGKLQEEVSFIDVTFIGKTAEIADEYLRKGDQACIAGRLKQESWEAKGRDGGKRSKVVVICEELKFVNNGGGGGGGGKSRRRDDDDDDRGSDRRRRRDDDDDDRGSSRERSRREDDDDDRGSQRESRSKREREDD